MCVLVVAAAAAVSLFALFHHQSLLLLRFLYCPAAWPAENKDFMPSPQVIPRFRRTEP